ncbi:dephospho-CoA kinase [Poriferisphaera sp. WC338]|uniref:dephospho-CoA kinase n=1 Tax=Poriferisphaera sp. WC338 TaxID=3425129 RepID=UPI003D819E98
MNVRPEIEQYDSGGKPVVGMMGAPGSGKSLVASQFGELGMCVINADDLARAALKDRVVKDQLRELWGESVIGSDGEVDRAAVAERVFDDQESLRQLEAILHPIVHRGRKEMYRVAVADGSVRGMVEDCPLLLETGLDTHCDVLVYVDAPQAIRERRVRENRGWSPSELAEREKNQASLDTKRERADYVVSNDADQKHCMSQVRKIMSLIFP